MIVNLIIRPLPKTNSCAPENGWFSVWNLILPGGRTVSFGGVLILGNLLFISELDRMNTASFKIVGMSTPATLPQMMIFGRQFAVIWWIIFNCPEWWFEQLTLCQRWWSLKATHGGTLFIRKKHMHKSQMAWPTSWDKHVHHLWNLSLQHVALHDCETLSSSKLCKKRSDSRRRSWGILGEIWRWTSWWNTQPLLRYPC